MIFAIVLVITWLILLLRYPRHALPILALAVVSMGLLVTGVLWQESRLEARLNALSLELRYAPDTCPAEAPLELTLSNPNTQALKTLRFKVSAFAPQVSANLVQSGYAEQTLALAHSVTAEQTLISCLALPALRPGYRPSTLQFVAGDLRGDFD